MPVLTEERPTVPAREAAYAPDTPHLFRPRQPRPQREPRARQPKARGGVVRRATVVVLAGLALLGLARLGDLVPSLHNPFQSHTVDRTGPVVLKAVTDLHEYKAASGSFQVLVDLEKDTKYVPAVLKGERTLFVAVGSVDASIDFSRLGADSVAVSPDRRSATLTIPHALLSGARIDTSKSYVANRNRGLLDRIGSAFSDNPTSEKALYRAAEAKMGDAAAADDSLRTRAEDNTRQMLTSLLTSLGFTSVTVNFA
jgi:hypothetical protein